MLMVLAGCDDESQEQQLKRYMDRAAVANFKSLSNPVHIGELPNGQQLFKVVVESPTGNSWEKNDIHHVYITDSVTTMNWKERVGKVYHQRVVGNVHDKTNTPLELTPEQKQEAVDRANWERLNKKYGNPTGE